MKKAIMWSKESCIFCDSAKELLIEKGYEIEERKIGKGYTKEQLLEEVPSARTVPQITLEEKYGWCAIGGYDDLKRYFRV